MRFYIFAKNKNQTLKFMKKIKNTLILSILSVSIFAQDTLQHFSLDIVTPITESYPSNQGYYTGHNSYGDEEFAEKYDFNGTTNILGVIAVHQGTNGTSSMNASYKIYDVGVNGLPGTELASKSVPYNDIPIDGTPNTVMFTNPVPVSADFFVSFNLGDYIHSNLGTQSIAITHSPNGTRPASDFGIFGRNVIRWHNHNGPATWKDYRTQNIPNYQPAVYFSLFPIVELTPSSIVVFGDQKGSVGCVYPNPSSSAEFNIPITSRNGGEVNITLYDLQGKIVSSKKTNLTAGKTNYVYSESKLTASTYILLVKTPEGIVAQQVVID